MTEKIISLTMAILTVGVIFFVGFITGGLVSHDPTPEQCLNVCVEQFEKMAA